jgi:hypothetical protein
LIRFAKPAYMGLYFWRKDLKMNIFKTMAASAALAVLGSTSFAATIETTGYTSTNLETLDGFAFFDAENFAFDAESFDGFITLNAFLPFADTDASLDYLGFAAILDSIQVSVMTELAQFLFADGLTRYLLTVDATGNTDVKTGDDVNFQDSDDFALFDVNATIKLDRLDLIKTNVVPLPAGMVLLLTGIGGLALVRRVRRGELSVSVRLSRAL